MSHNQTELTTAEMWTIITWQEVDGMLVSGHSLVGIVNCST